MDDAITAKIEAAAQLVRDRDRLWDERNRMTATIDARIQAIETKLAALFAVGTPPAETPQPRSGSVKERALNLLRARPEIDSKGMALALYDEDDETARNRVRSIVHVLRGDGLLKGEWGKWEVIDG